MLNALIDYKGNDADSKISSSVIDKIQEQLERHAYAMTDRSLTRVLSAFNRQT